MAAKFESVEVPFVTIRGRRALTDKQLSEDPALVDFVDRFRASFERDETLFAWLFIEPEVR